MHKMDWLKFEYRIRGVLRKYFDGLSQEQLSHPRLVEISIIVGEESGRGYEHEFAARRKAQAQGESS